MATVLIVEDELLVDIALALDAALHGDHARGEDDAALPSMGRRPDNKTGNAGLVLDGINVTPLADPGF